MVTKQTTFNFTTWPLYRSTDPSTSRMAAEAMVESGKIGRQEQIILDGIIHHPGLTAAELSDYIPLRHDQTHKRLRGMVRKGLLVEGPIRMCRKHGTQMVTWYPRMNEGQGGPTHA
jgi:hypothetical protein